MASADPPTPANLDHQDDAATLTCPRLPDGHPAVEKLKKLTPPSHRTSDIDDSGLSSAWSVPLPPPEPPPPPQPPPPPPCPLSIVTPAIDSGFQQRPALQLPLGSAHTVLQNNDTVADPGLSSSWQDPPPDPPPPQPPPPHWCPPPLFPPAFDGGFQQRLALHLPLGAQPVLQPSAPSCNLITELDDPHPVSSPPPPEPPPSWLTPALIPPWPPPAPWPWQIPSIRPLAIVMPCRYTSGTSANRTSALPSSLPILSLLHPHLWGLSWTELRDAPSSANAPCHCASFRATNGTHMAPLPPSVEFTFGTSAPSSGYRAASSSFIFLPPSTHTFHEPLPMVFGRQSIDIRNNKAQDVPSARTIRRFKVRTTPRQSLPPMAFPSRVATQLPIHSSSSARHL